MAAKLFREGREASRNGDVEAACVRFRESNALVRAPGTLLNLSICEQSLGHLALAWGYLQDVIAMLPVDDDRRPLAEAQLEELNQRIPWLTLSLSSEGRQAAGGQRVVVLLDGAELPTTSLGTALPLDPGRHTIVVEVSGRSPKTYEQTLLLNQRATLELEPGPPLVEPDSASSSAAQSGAVGAKEPPPPPAVADRAEGGAGIWPYVIGGVGLVLVGTGVAFHQLAGGQDAIIDAECDAGYCTDAGLKADVRKSSYRRVSTAGFVAGGVALGAGAWLMIAATPSDGVTPGATPASGWNLAVTGSW